jgi:GTPase SAR1 family protein
MVDPQLPLELRGKGNKEVLSYYRDLLAAASVVSRRCRVMLLGTGGVGKTTLAHRLVTGSPATHSADVTHGVLQRTYTSPHLAALPTRFE